VSIRIYTVDIDGIIAVYDEVTAALAQWNSTPASVLVEVARLADPRMLVEVEAVAVR
jgi:enamine deaminase RidA (YjgF/YER057c/UK114 family)